MLSRVICYVCGSLGGVCTLHVQCNENGPYFPFLENHEPPKGSRPPTSNGLVDSCRVCYSFLIQQWDTYEKNKTPPIKRLYWLKRVDNGTFTGAEMRMQGEYAAQVMGLQYQPSNSGTLSPFDYTGMGTSGNHNQGSRKGVISPGGSSYLSSRGIFEDATNSSPCDEALDLSYANTGGDTKNEAPQKKTPKEERKSSHTPEDICRTEPTNIVCYICAKEHPTSLGRFVYATKHGDEPFFPFLYKIIPPPSGCMPLTKNGITKACSGCRKALCRQWRYFESNDIPEDQRTYLIDEKPVPSQNMGLENVRQNDVEHPSDHESERARGKVCYICTRVIKQGEAVRLNTTQEFLNGNVVMFIPEILTLKAPPNSIPLDKNGRVESCLRCHVKLEKQWQTYEKDGVPLKDRTFSLPGVHRRNVSPEKSDPSKKGHSQPLNILISNHSLSSTSSTFSTTSSRSGPIVSDLLAIAPSAKSPMNENLCPSDILTPKKVRNQYKCVVCGILTSCVKALQAHPLKREPGIKEDQISTWPFFPFLTNPSYGGLASISKDGTVICCNPCYYSLHLQWRDFEESSNIEEQNRWLRKYRTKLFTCYTCGKDTKRQNICEVHISKYPFLMSLLQQLPRVKSAIYMAKEEIIVVCDECERRLHDHFLRTKHERYDKKVIPTNLKAAITDDDQSKSNQSDSFATALRKMANQVEKSESHEVGPEPLSGAASTSPRDHAKRGSMMSSMCYPSRDHGTTTIHSPPAVAQTSSRTGYLAVDSVRKSLERPEPTSSHGSSMVDPHGIKQEVERRAAPSDRRDEERPRSKESSQRLTSHSVLGNIPGSAMVSSPEDPLVRGFQPYRPGEDSIPRPPYGSAPYPGLESMYSAAAAAAYHNAFQPAHPFSHPAFRFDDPVFLERYRLMQASPLGFPYNHASMIASHNLHPLLPGGARFPGDVLAGQHLPYLSSASHVSPAHASDRTKNEEEMRRQREKDLEREKEREREREQREKERELKEREEKERRERERIEREKEYQERERQERERAIRKKIEESRFSLMHPQSRKDHNFLKETTPTNCQPGQQYHHSRGEPLNMSKVDRDRVNPRSPENERGRSFIHSQEQPRKDQEKREMKTSAALSLTIPKVSLDSETQRIPDVHAHNFHRPFERVLSNGYEREKNSENEIRNVNEKELPANATKTRDAIDSYKTNCERTSKGNHGANMNLSTFSLENRMGRGSNLLGGDKSRHEGIQARLYLNDRPAHNTSEKDGSVVLDINARLVETVTPAQTNNTIACSQTTGNHIPHSLNGPISKLDLAERRLKRKHSTIEHCSDASEDEAEEDDDSDDEKRNRLMVVSAGLPVKLDKSPDKLCFLANFGLATHLQCREKEFENRRKRRRLYRESSISPVLLDDGDSSITESALPTYDKSRPCVNESTDSKSKNRFLHTLGLDPVPVDKKHHMELIRKVCDWDKRRRLGDRGLPPPLQPVENHVNLSKSIPARYSGQGPHKRKLLEYTSSPLTTLATDAQKISLSQLAAQHSSQLVERYQNDTKSSLSDKNNMNISRDFAQEFHNSVLQTTRQHERHCQRRHGPRHRQEYGERVSESSNAIDNVIMNDEISSKSSTMNSGRPVDLIKSRNEMEIRWPGIEAIIEAYQKHSEEQRLEKQILYDQCQRLQQINREYNRSAEKLSMQMSELLKRKQRREEDRLQRQTCIDNLMKCLKYMR